MKRLRKMKLFAFMMMMVMALGMTDVTSFAAGTADHGSRTAVNSEAELRDAANAGGNYYLAADISAGTITIPSGKVFNLCLHGHDINHRGWESAIVVSGGATFNLSDESDTGCIRGGYGTGGGGFEYDGAGILNLGTFNMTGGVITENSTYSRYGGGGGVYNEGTFSMSGGVISNNEAGSGGGVCNDGTFNMTGGKITGNSAYNYNLFGGRGGGVENLTYATFNISGGEITGNSAHNYFGGVAGEVNISGTPVIRDNTVGGVPSDCQSSITITGPLSGESWIGITAGSEPERGQNRECAAGWDTSYGDPADRFFADHKGCEVKVDGSDDTKLVLHFHGGGRVEGREATCTGTGLKAYYKCTCGRIYEDNEGTREITGDLDEWRVTPPKGHDWTNFSYDWSEDHSSCTAHGVCSRDSSHKISKKGTITSEVFDEATCTNPAIVIFTAEFDDPAIPSDVMWALVGEPLGHDWQPPEYTWADDKSSCTAMRMCSRSRNHRDYCEATVTSSRTKDPGCTEMGEITYTAEFEEPWAEQQTMTVKDGEPVGHEWMETGYRWSADGSECTAYRVCSRDSSHIEEKTVKTTPVQIKAPTCTERGETEYTAEFPVSWAEPQKKVIDDIEASGHDWNETVYTWSEDGSSCTAERVCRSNGEHKEKAAGTVTEVKSKDPTCTEKGETTYTAVFDVPWAVEQTITINDIEAHGHDWNETVYTWNEDGSSCTASRKCRTDADHVETSDASVSSEQTKAPTCTDMGETTYTADFAVPWADQQKMTVADIDALGHSFGDQWKYDEKEHWHECVCGARTDIQAHVYGDWKVTKEPTRNTAGEKERTCECGHAETAEVPVLPPYEAAGDGQEYIRGSGDEIGFTLDGGTDSLVRIEVDGSPLGDGDYIIDGDRVILQKDYLDSLGAGQHEIVFIYEDGQCSASFTVKAGAAAGDQTGIGGPKTGDHQDMIWYVLAAAGALMAAAYLIFTGRRRSER